MNKFTSMSVSRKGVSPWIAALVIAVIMALIVAVLPMAATSARADESEATVTNDFTISEITDDSVVSDESNSLEEAPTTDTADVVEDPAAESGVPGGEVTPDADPESGFLDGIINELQNNGLISPLQVVRAPGAVNVDIEFTDIESIPAHQDGNVYVGDTVRISGTWDGQLTAGGAAQTFIDGDTFSIPFPDQVTVIPNNIRLTDATDPTSSWGTCTPNQVTNAYDCLVVGADLPQGQDQPFGGFSATAYAEAEGTFGNGLTILPRQQGDLLLSKSVEHILTGPQLGNEPSGTVFSYLVQVSGSALAGRTQPLVLVDTFDEDLTFNEVFSITAVDSFGTMPVSHVFDSVTNTLTVTLAPEVAFAGDTVNVRYRLVTESGGLDPIGTEYVNTVATEGITAEARITQIYENAGSGQGVNRGSFELTKIVEEVPAGFDRTNYPFSIQVDEYAPGNFPGTRESTYNLDVVDGQVVTGLTARPAGWTIVLSENLDRSVYNWDEPVFSGNGVTTFVENGKTFARFETVAATNIGISLTNRVSTPQIGTTAQVEGSTDNILSLAGGTVVDTVAYENLKPNTAYTLEGEIVAVDAAGVVTPTGITASGEFTTPDAAAGQFLVSGTAEMTFNITAAQAAAWANQKLVVYETLFEVGVTAPIAEHRNPNDVAQTFWVAPGEPEIGTLAQVQDVNNPKLLPLTGGEVVDTVSYTFLNPETEYRLEGELMHVAADGTVTPTGITTSGEFTTPAAPTGQLYVSGTAAVSFTITGAQAAEYGGQNLVVYEELYDVATNALVAEHKDATDADQTFRVQQPGIDIGTSAATNGPNTKLLPLTGGQVVDTVSYTNLDPLTEYRLEGELMHVAADGTVTATGITASGEFTTPAATGGDFYVSGTALVVFDITADEATTYGGQDLVVYEELFLVSTGALLAEHKNPNDQLQTFTIERPEVEIGTKATVTDDPAGNILPITGGEVIDTVSYTNLDPETEYRLEGELMHVDGATVTATGIFGTTTFTTPAAAAGENYVSGTIDVVFTITGAEAYEYGGEKLVVFENLFLVSTDALIADHRDANDEEQTFYVDERTPEIGTRADVTGTDTKVLPVTGGEVIDTVTYTDLKPNTEYRLDGELMHVVGNTATPTGIFGTTTFTTPAAAAGENYVSGTIEVTFTISGADATQYAGQKLVVYEELFDVATDEPVAEHKNPNDEDQSFNIEPGGKIIVDKKVTGPKGDQVERDESSVFQVRAEWTDSLGNEQSRTFNVTPGEPVSLEGLPLNTEITLTEVGADTDVSNVKWGDIVWSGTGVVDQPGNSPDGIITITNPDAPIQVGLENKTSSNGLIIIPIPIPLPPAGGVPTPPPAPVAPVTPPAPPEVSPVSPKDGIQPSPKDGIQPQGAAPQRGAAPQAQQTGLAATGADVVLLAGGGIAILILGAWLVLRGRRNES